MSKSDEVFEHPSGASSSGRKPPYHLIPLSLLRRTAYQLGIGAERHGFYNYEKGLKDREYILERLGHAVEHLQKAMDSISRGIVTNDDHLAGIVCNVAFAMEYQERLVDPEPSSEELERDRQKGNQAVGHMGISSAKPGDIIAIDSTLSPDEVMRMSREHYYNKALRTWVPRGR